MPGDTPSPRGVAGYAVTAQSTVTRMFQNAVVKL